MEEHKIICMIKESEHLPQIPKEFGDVLRMLMAPVDYNIDQCVENFSRFPKLGEFLIEIVNFNTDFYRKINSLKEAINYLGATNAKIIAIAYVTRLMLPDRFGKAKLFDNKIYWKHCIGTSIAAYLISEETNISNKDKMFTYGLIHDIGISALDVCLPDYLDKVFQLMQKGVHQIAAEKIVLSGITHAEIGMWLCKEWRLPEEMAATVGLHHTPLLAKNHVDEVRIMHLADSISANYYEHLLGIPTNFIYADKVMDALKLDRNFVDQIIQRLPAEIEKLNKKIKL